MKRISIALTLVLFSGSLLLANGQSSPSISPRGTLLGLPSAEGRSSLDGLEHDGFSLSYKASGGMWRAVWAIGEEHSRLWAGQISFGVNSASVKVRTADGALEITNSFTLNEQNELIIRRTLKNKSIKKLHLKMTEYVDSKLLGTSSPTQLRARAFVRIRARGCKKSEQNQLIERPPHDFCMPGVICPDTVARLSTTQDSVSLTWNCSKTVDPGKEVHFDVWVGLQNANQ